MARIRSIKPEFWEDEKLSALPFEARLFFIGMWNFADDQGVIRAIPKVLKAKVFPYDDIPITSIAKWCSLLVTATALIPFTHNGESFFIIRTFGLHQKVDARYIKLIVPAEVVEDKLNTFNSGGHNVTTPGPHREHTVNTSQEWSGVERSVIGSGDGEDVESRAANGPRTPDLENSNFKFVDSEPQPTSQPEQKKQTGPGRKKQAGKPTSLEDSQWGDRAAFDAALPDWDQAKLDHYWDALKNYSNKGNVFKDWIQTAQNWERKDREKAGKNGHAKPESPTQTDDITRIIDEFNALTQSQYDPADEAIRGFLAGRLMDGCQLQDMLDVIAVKAIQWGTGDSRKYLKFHILFKPEKYPGYVQEVKDAKSGKIKVINPNESAYDRIQRKIDAALGRTQSA